MVETIGKVVIKEYFLHLQITSNIIVFQDICRGEEENACFIKDGASRFGVIQGRVGKLIMRVGYTRKFS